MAQVQLQKVQMSYGPVRAVRDADITFDEGLFTTLLGPSGCGKTTILRMIAGLERPTGGDVFIAGRRVNDVPIHQRNLGLVFQNYALFPHKTIEQNIAFGLKYRGASKSEARDKVRQALDIVRLPGVESRYPAQLSGGQQQRIALARAIVIEPSVLLLDEPLSALDANLREEMRVELSTIQQRIGVTTIFVTHDQSEALAMSDRIVVMSDGCVEQEGGPEEVYNTPASEFVARFLGAANILDAKVAGIDGAIISLETACFGRIPVPLRLPSDLEREQPAKLVIRAEKLKVSARSAQDASSSRAISAKGVIEAVDYQGQVARYFVNAGGVRLQVIDMMEDRPFSRGAEVAVHLRPEHCTVLPP